MQLGSIVHALELLAPPSLQEDYDNSGLLVGNTADEVNKAILCLDCTESVIDEAIREGCDLVIAHHPIVFRGLKRLNGKNYVERTVIKAIQNNIAIYACHTNLDNIYSGGVNALIAEKLGLSGTEILKPLAARLLKLVVFVPTAHSESVKDALFQAGAGAIGQYDECSFSLEGTGTFRGNAGTNPYVGEAGKRHSETEQRVEVILPDHSLAATLAALRKVHPYEEIAYDLYRLENDWARAGSGLTGKLPEVMSRDAFLAYLKEKMELPLVRYTAGPERIEKIAVCGGAGSFLIGNAKAAGVQAYVTSDVKYHEFFDGESELMICDIGHYESEKYTPEIFARFLSEKFPNFATIFANTLTNPVHYYF